MLAGPPGCNQLGVLLTIYVHRRNITENLRLQEEVNSLRAIVHVMRNRQLLAALGCL